jgi:hypothetical protein
MLFRARKPVFKDMNVESMTFCALKYGWVSGTE